MLWEQIWGVETKFRKEQNLGKSGNKKNSKKKHLDVLEKVLDNML